MILTRKQILDRMDLGRYPVTDAKSLVITPLLSRDLYSDKNLLDADSVDLRLGCHFLLPKTLDQPFFSPDSSSATSLHDPVHIPLGQFLVVPAHQTILGATLEFIKLPHDVSGQVLTKSSIARTFIVVETAPWIHPEYRGCLTLEIANVSNTPVLLYPGRFICQLILMLNAPEEEEAAESSGKGAKEGDAVHNLGYFGPVYPEAPKFKDPQDDLLSIGVRSVSTVKRQQLLLSHGRWRQKS
jgi:dCTP deaminase